MNLFKNFKSKKVGGYIAYFNLNTWWLDELLPEERTSLKTIFDLMFYTEDSSLDEGIIDNVSESKIEFITSLCSFFTTSEHYNIGKKLIALGQSEINKNTTILEEHYFYLEAIKLYSNNLNYDENALKELINYSKKQILISNQAKKELNDLYPDSPLPSHAGFNSLSKLYEKRSEYNKALELLIISKEQGWQNPDIDDRINKLKELNCKLKIG